MDGSTRRRPSPAMIVAMIALCLGLGGSAIAAGDLTKSQVKKIAKKQANKQITKRAPDLSVKNADQLGGKAASAYAASGLPAFKPVTLVNSWAQASNGSTPGYWIDPFGTVHIQGGLKEGVNTLAFTLPVEARPASVRGFPAQCGSDGPGRVEVEPDGEVRIYTLAGANCATFAYIDGIDYRTDN